jgi:hypothetical protein
MQGAAMVTPSCVWTVRLRMQCAFIDRISVWRASFASSARAALSRVRLTESRFNLKKVRTDGERMKEIGKTKIKRETSQSIVE